MSGLTARADKPICQRWHRIVSRFLRVITLASLSTAVAAHVSPAQSGRLTAELCEMVDASLEETRTRLPVQTGKATTMLALEASMGREADRCTLYGVHAVDTDAAARQLLLAAHRGGQEDATLDDAYREMGTDRYRRAMIRLMREQVAAHPLIQRAKGIPEGLLDSVVIEFVYVYSASRRVSVDPIVLRFKPADILPGQGVN